MTDERVTTFPLGRIVRQKVLDLKKLGKGAPRRNLCQVPNTIVTVAASIDEAVTKYWVYAKSETLTLIANTSAES